MTIIIIVSAVKVSKEIAPIIEEEKGEGSEKKRIIMWGEKKQKWKVMGKDVLVEERRKLRR